MKSNKPSQEQMNAFSVYHKDYVHFFRKGNEMQRLNVASAILNNTALEAVAFCREIAVQTPNSEEIVKTLTKLLNIMTYDCK